MRRTTISTWMACDGETKSEPEICETCGKRRRMVDSDMDDDLIESAKICHRCGRAYIETKE